MGMRSGSRILAAASSALLATACAGGGEARDFGGRWRPLNQYAASSEAIALREEQVFQATPMDGTLHGLLARWARDAGSGLDYRHPFDFTLHEPVRRVHAGRLQDALAQLEDAFDGYGLAIRVEAGRIVVATDPGGGG